MAKVHKYGLTAPSMKALGRTIRLMALVNSGTPTETFTKANGLMIKPTERAYMFTLMGQNMMATGKMTFNMAKELKIGSTALVTPVSTPLE